MMSSTFSIETILSAMMCMCSSNNNSTYDMYSTFAEKINYNQTKPLIMDQAVEIMAMKNKLANIEKQLAEDKLQTALKKSQCEAPQMRVGLPPLLECPKTNAVRPNRIFNIKLLKSGKVFPVLCNGDNDYGKAWMVIQRRIDGSENFLRGWYDYQHGFGSLSSEFFIGLDYVHALTTAKPHDLIIILENFEGVRRFAKYERFEIGSEIEDFQLKILDKYSGNAGDSLSKHILQKFSTHDKSNGAPWNNKAVRYTGGWWFSDEIIYSNLNGQYLGERPSEVRRGQGIIWDSSGGQYNWLKSVKMMIRAVA